MNVMERPYGEPVARTYIIRFDTCIVHGGGKIIDIRDGLYECRWDHVSVFVICFW